MLWAMSTLTPGEGSTIGRNITSTHIYVSTYFIPYIPSLWNPVILSVAKNLKLRVLRSLTAFFRLEIEVKCQACIVPIKCVILSRMVRSNHVSAPKSATGKCRDRRHPWGRRRLAWVRSFRRAQRELDACVALIDSSLRTAAASEHSVHGRPIRTSRDLHQATSQLADASGRLGRAASALARTNEYMAREPERAVGAPALIISETERWVDVAAYLQEAAGGVFALQENVLGALESGELVPEPEPERRPRIVLVPRPAPVRAFLRLRLPRVIERITPILRRRRRTPRPAALRVPRRSVLGRAPPLSPVRRF